MGVEQWEFLFDVLLLLVAALVLGAICERLKQSAILGYLLAGTLMGPNALYLIGDAQQVDTLAELGVAMLLFSIGLEFSWRRLRQLGAVALVGGSLQVFITGALAAGVAAAFNLPGKTAIAIGAMVALSSTACVLRLLSARAEIDSQHGRSALGVLLLQDLAVVPLVLLVTAMGGENSSAQIAWAVVRASGMAILMVAVFYILFNTIVPRALHLQSMRRNRELPTLLGIITGLGSACIAHWLGLSPAVGAFVAGILLAESPFATQIRSDVSSLRTLLMTLFFASVGMLGDPVWIASNLLAVLLMVVAIVFGKAVIIWALLRRFDHTHRSALAAGACLGQVGEFSFVLATIARGGGLLSEDLFLLFISATIITLFLTPYLVGSATKIGAGVADILAGWGWIQVVPTETPAEIAMEPGHVLLVGYGPAGQAVGLALHRLQRSVTVIDLNPKAIDTARQLGFYGHVGDASQSDVLDHVHAALVSFVIITIPDPLAARRTIELIRAIAPEAQIIARARYHVYRWELQMAGAHVVVDEEEHVGHQLGREVRRAMRAAPSDPTESQTTE